MEHVDQVQSSTSHPLTFDSNGWTVFALICVTLLTMVHIQQKMILTDQVYFNTWSQQLAYDRVEALLEMKNKWLWIGYIITPLIVLLQVFFVASCLTTGALIGNIKGSFRFFFGIVLRCYPVLMLQGGDDQQVIAAETPLLEKAFRDGGNQDVTARVFPALNHFFILQPGGDPAGYSTLATNLASAEVLGVVADWIAMRATHVPSP